MQHIQINYKYWKDRSEKKPSKQQSIDKSKSVPVTPDS